MSKKLTLGSLFDGSGGFPLAGLLSDITPIPFGGTPVRHHSCLGFGN